MSLSLCSNDNSFGPAADCRSLDFTLYFENWVLSFSPDVIFVVFALARMVVSAQQSRKLSKPGLSLAVKLLCTSLVVAANATRVGELTAFPQDTFRSPGNFTVVGMALASSVLLVSLSVLEHFTSVAPSTLILTYAVTKAVLNGAILRTYSAIGIIGEDRSLYVATCISTAGYGLTLLSELVEKRSLLLPEFQDSNSEATSSSLSRMLFGWLLPVLVKGRKTRLTLADLKDIPHHFTAAPARDALQRALKSTEKTTLFSATVKAFGLTMLEPVIPRLLLLLLTFAQPLLVDDMITFVSSDEPSSRGWAIVGGFVCVYSLMFVVTCMYWEKVYYNVVQYRSALVGTIYLKTLRLASHTSKTVGTGAASTYMSVDVERVCECFQVLHELWAAALSVAIAEVILYKQAGWPGFLPIPVMVVVLGICGVAGVSVGKRQAKWMGAVDKRIKLMSSVVSQFLSVKWFNYEQPFQAKITQLREAEVEEYRHFLNMLNLTVSLANNASILCTLAVLGVYAGTLGRGSLDATRLFTIATTVNLLNGPLNILGQNIPSVLAGYASLLRIAKFLTLEEISDTNREEELKPRSTEDKTGSLRMDKASFSWGTDGEPYLRDVDLSIEQGEVKVFIGKVGSGKSMLLKSLIGETICRSGTYAKPSFRIAYAGQDAFIAPGTIRENILFGRPYDKERYDRVVSACALLPDFANMPKGDETFLQEAGGGVSGGQRQRIGLARAVYANCAITLLDCPFSALDAKTEDHVFNSLFRANGLLEGKSVLLATHNIQHTVVGNEIFVLEKGRVTHRGSADEIREQGFDLTHYLANDDASDAKAVPALAEEPDASKPSADDEGELDLASRGVTNMLFYNKTTGSLRVAVYFFSVVLMCGVQLGCKGILQQWSDSPESQWRRWVGAFGGLSVLAMLCTTTCFTWFIYITRRTSLGMHERELSGLFRTLPSFFMSTPSGTIINRFSADIMQLDLDFPISGLNLGSQGLTIIGTLVIILIPTPYLALSLVVLGPLYYALLQFYLATSKQLQKLEAASKSPLYTMFSATISGLDVIRTFGAQTYFQDLNDEHLNRSQGPFHYRFAGMRLLRAGLTLMTLVLAIGLACLAVGLRSSKEASALGLSLSNLTSLTGLLSNWLMAYAEFENSSVSITRIRQIAELPVEEADSDSQFQIPSNEMKDTQWPSRGAIVFRDVSFRYKQELPEVLSRVSFSVKPGLKVGICGRTGSGKSTIILSILRAVEDSLISGSILIDGVDVSQLPPSTVRRSLSLVTQEPFLWFSSLRENLDIEHTCTDAEVWDALALVGMKDIVTELPEKLDTVLEGGGSFSRGERQLLCLARVLLRRRQIVLLDEATSSMDENSQAKIVDVIHNHLKEQTVIAVAHRLSSIVDFDLVLVVGGGEILESGHPRTLLADPSSSFYSLATSQGLVSQSTITGSREVATEIQSTS